MRTKRIKSQLLIIFSAVGFLLGILYQNLISTKSSISVELLTRGNLQRYLQTEVIAEKYLWYVIKERLLLLSVICILSCMKWKKLLVGLCLGIGGFLGGILTVSAILQFGIKGILLCIIGVFPQGIFYGMAYFMLFTYWFRLPEGRWNRAKLIFVIVMFLTGIILEAYVNPLLVKWVIKLI